MSERRILVRRQVPATRTEMVFFRFAIDTVMLIAIDATNEGGHMRL